MQPERFSFVWIPDLITTCLLCGGTVRFEDSTLTAVGPSHERVDLTLGICSRCYCRFGLYEELYELLTNMYWAPEDLQELRAAGKPLTIGAWVEADQNIVPYDVMTAELSRFGLDMTSEALPAPDVAEVEQLTVVDERWELATRAIPLNPGTEDAMTMHIAVVVDGDELIRQFAFTGDEPLTPPKLAALIYEAAVRPRSESAPGRPACVHVGDDQLAQALGAELQPAGIAVRVGDTSLVDAALDQMSHRFEGIPQNVIFANEDPDVVWDYFDAADLFYHFEIWNHFDGDRHLGFKVGDEPWRYANVMGQMGDEPGISVFETWLQLCLFIQNPPDYFDDAQGHDAQRRIAASGSLEGITLSPVEALHPEDAVLLESLGILDALTRDLPFPLRFAMNEAGQVETVAPTVPVATYRALMGGLCIALANRNDYKPLTSFNRTVYVDDVPVSFSYPSRGLEALGDDTGMFRLVVTGIEGRGTILPKGATIEIDVPGDARLEEVAWAVRREGGDDFWGLGILSEGFYLWNADMGRGGTMPRVVHIQGLRSLEFELVGGTYPFHIMRQLRTDLSEIRVRIEMPDRGGG